MLGVPFTRHRLQAELGGLPIISTNGKAVRHISQHLAAMSISRTVCLLAVGHCFAAVMHCVRMFGSYRSHMVMVHRCVCISGSNTVRPQCKTEDENKHTNDFRKLHA